MTWLASPMTSPPSAPMVSPDRPVHLVGHDWGGIQGWEFVAAPRFAGAIASFTSIAGPALGHAVGGGARGAAIGTARQRGGARPPLVVHRPAVPAGRPARDLADGDGRRIGGAGFWSARTCRSMTVYAAPTRCADGLHGAKLYRQNIPRRIVGRGPRAGGRPRAGTADRPVARPVHLRGVLRRRRTGGAAARAPPPRRLALGNPHAPGAGGRMGRRVRARTPTAMH